MPLYLLLGLLTTSAAREDSVVLITGGYSGFPDHNDYGDGLLLSSVETLGDSCPVPSLPLVLTGHATVLTQDGLVLTCGGLDGEEEYNLSCFVLDPATATWLPHSTLDSPRTFSPTVSPPSGVFLLGDDYEFSESSSFLATGSTRWVPGPPLLSPKEDACAISISATQFLVIGGYPDTRKVEEYDTTTGEWTSWPELTAGRSYHSCSLIGDTVVIAGGTSDNEPILSTTLLDISSQRQRPGGDMTSARAYFQIVNHEDKLLAIGGQEQDFTGLKTVEEWNPTEEVWTPRGDLDMTIFRAGFGAVSAPRSAVCAANQ